jgi:hypothetical protein
MKEKKKEVNLDRKGRKREDNDKYKSKIICKKGKE